MFERKMNLDMKTRFNAMKKEKSDLQEEFLEMKVKFHRVKEESQDHVRIFFLLFESETTLSNYRIVLHILTTCNLQVVGSYIEVLFCYSS